MRFRSFAPMAWMRRDRRSGEAWRKELAKKRGIARLAFMFGYPTPTYPPHRQGNLNGTARKRRRKAVQASRRRNRH
jgi:hypothetical protein